MPGQSIKIRDCPGQSGTYGMYVSPLVHIFDIGSLFAAELEEPKIGISGNRL